MVTSDAKRDARCRRSGVALLMCLFMIFMVSTMVLNIVQTETLQLAATRNSLEYEKALYLANAGIHHACSELMADASWRGSVSEGTVPPASSLDGYTATATTDSDGNVAVTSTGYAGLGSRTLEATIEL